MKSIIGIIGVCMFVLLVSCNSSELVENWKNPDITTFEAQKVLVLAMTNDLQNRRLFEKRLVSELEERGVQAVISDDFFSPEFTERPRTEEELDRLEKDLLSEGFDAILVSKLIGAENKVTLVQSYRNFDKLFNGFEDDYYASQGLYVEDEVLEKYTLYHAESSLYCICPTKDREIIWKGAIDITEPENKRQAIKDYVNLLMWALEEQEILITTPDL